VGAFWNPYSGIIINGRRLSKREVSRLKRSWSKQLRLSEMNFFGWFRKAKETIASLFKFFMVDK
jgi:hypothetical protein